MDLISYNQMRWVLDDSEAHVESSRGSIDFLDEHERGSLLHPIVVLDGERNHQYDKASTMFAHEGSGAYAFHPKVEHTEPFLREQNPYGGAPQWNSSVKDMYTSTPVLNGAMPAHSHTHPPMGAVRESADRGGAMLSRNPAPEDGRDVGSIQTPSRGGLGPVMEEQTNSTTPTPYVVKTEGGEHKAHLDSHEPTTPETGGEGKAPKTPETGGEGNTPTTPERQASDGMSISKVGRRGMASSSTSTPIATGTHRTPRPPDEMGGGAVEDESGKKSANRVDVMENRLENLIVGLTECIKQGFKECRRKSRDESRFAQATAGSGTTHCAE